MTNILTRNRKEIITMSVDDFINLPEHVGTKTAQRNTPQRAEKSIKGHLAVLGINHDEVRAAVHPDGHWARTDGNTRALLWSTGRLERPVQLTVVVTHCATIEDFDEAYIQVDNIGQAKSKDDLAYGVMRANNFVPTAPLLQAPKLSVALWVAMESKQIAGGAKMPHKFDEHEAIVEWLPELKLLDTIGIKGSYWGSGVIGGALIALRIARNTSAEAVTDILEFFTKYDKNQGETRPNEERPTCDAVYALRQQKAKGSGGWDKAEDLAGKVIAATKLWKKRGYIFNTSDNKPKLTSSNIQGLTFKF